MKTILVVAEDLAIAEVIKLLLEQNGYKVFVTVNAQEALLRINALHFDLILTDLNGNGIGLSEDLVRDKRYRDIPIIFMTAATKVWHLPPKTIIMKPFSLDELIKHVEAHIGKGESYG